MLNPTDAAGADRVLAELAMLIAGPSVMPERWLLIGICNAVNGIRWAIHSEAAHPARENLRHDLLAAQTASLTLLRVLCDEPVMRVIREASTEDITGEIQLYQSLGSLRARINLAVKAVPTGRGSHKFDPGTNNPVQACALSVAFAWRATQGRLPPHTSLKARQACRLLWELAGGAPSGYGGNQSLSGWVEHLRRANVVLGAEDRPEVARLFPRPPG